MSSNCGVLDIVDGEGTSDTQKSQGVPESENKDTSDSGRPGRVPKKRARRACLSCRTRKVRCDVTVHGIPCMNCRLDFQECIVKPRTRKLQYTFRQPLQQRPMETLLAKPPAVPQPALFPAGENVFDQDRAKRGGSISITSGGEDDNPADVDKDCHGSDMAGVIHIGDSTGDSAGDRSGDCAGDCTGEHMNVNIETGESLMDVTPRLDDFFLSYPDSDDLLDSSILRDEELLDLGQQAPASVASTSSMSLPAEPQPITETCESLLGFAPSPRPPLGYAVSGSTSSQEKLSNGPARPQPGSSNSFVQFSCYSFVEPDPMWRLTPEDASFLEQRGSLHLPSRPAFNEFMVQYFRHIHPIMPVLNENTFWHVYLNTGPPRPRQKRMSLFLAQAMLFISCPYVSAATLRSLGFLTVRKARADFYARAKALFDIDVHNDNVASAQGALMLTYHAPATKDKTNSYWLMTAVHFARNADADQYSAIDDHAGARGNGNGNSKTELKRLWWCCILRDRIMSLGLRRPLTIRPSDFDFAKQQGLTESDFQDEIHNSRVYKAPTKQVLVQLVVSLCELAVSLGNALSLLYPVGNGGRPRTEDPRQANRKIDACLVDLNWWYDKTAAKFSIPAHIFGVDESLILFTDMVYIYYHTAKVSLYNYKVQLSVTDGNSVENQRENQLEAQAELNASLQSITECLVELDQLGQIKYLPNTFVSFSALPFVWYILDAKLINQARSVPDDACRELKVYTHIMKHFRNLYENTDSVLQSIGTIVNYIKLHDLLQLPRNKDSAPKQNTGSTALASKPSSATGYKKHNDCGSGWVDLLAGKPQSYCRVTMTVEFFLSHGQLPPEDGFGKPLRTLRQETAETTNFDNFDGTDATGRYDGNVLTEDYAY